MTRDPRSRWEERIATVDAARWSDKCRDGWPVATDAPCPRCGHNGWHYPGNPRGDQ